MIRLELICPVHLRAKRIAMVPKETQHLQLFSVSKYWKISFRQLMAIGMRDHRTAATVVRGTLLDVSP